VTAKQKRRNLLVGFATALLLGQAIYGPIRTLLLFGGRAATDSGDLQDQLRAFSTSAPLREELRDHSVIGYVASESVDTSRGGLAELRYYIAQFALAPVLVSLDPGQRVVLANFGQPEQLERFLRRERLRTLVRIDAGRALVVLQTD
jgi:hypothetical protein